MADPIAHLLPANATPLCRALSQAMGGFAPARIVPTLWHADTCPDVVLPHLAWARSVDQWDGTWPEDWKRAMIAEAPEIHRLKGTPGSLRRHLAAVGHPDADIIERADYVRRDGSVLRDGTRRRFGIAGWATVRIVLKRPVTIDMAAQIASGYETVKRNCVHLIAIDYTRAALRHNGSAHRNGSYTRGVI